MKPSARAGLNGFRYGRAIADVDGEYTEPGERIEGAGSGSARVLGAGSAIGAGWPRRPGPESATAPSGLSGSAGLGFRPDQLGQLAGLGADGDSLRLKGQTIWGSVRV
ncbi:MAG: hypothetical protein ACHRXM_15360 [Isosphaerales bacterium]